MPVSRYVPDFNPIELASSKSRRLQRSDMASVAGRFKVSKGWQLWFAGLVNRKDRDAAELLHGMKWALFLSSASSVALFPILRRQHFGKGGKAILDVFAVLKISELSAFNFARSGDYVNGPFTSVISQAATCCV